MTRRSVCTRSPLFKTFNTRLFGEFVAKIGSVSAVTVALTTPRVRGLALLFVSSCGSGSETGAGSTNLSARGDRMRAVLVLFFSGILAGEILIVPLGAE